MHHILWTKKLEYAESGICVAKGNQGSKVEGGVPASFLTTSPE